MKLFVSLLEQLCKQERLVSSFYNSEVQRELGSRKKNRVPAARNAYVLAALYKGFSLQHATGEIITIHPFECASLVYVVDKLMASPLMNDKRAAWEACADKEKHYAMLSLP